MAKNLWTREELVMAFNLYCKIPATKINKRLPQIIEFAELIGRTPSAVTWKLVNLASIDPSVEYDGAKNGGKLDEEVFNEFNNNWNELALESEMLIEKYKERRSSPVQEERTTEREGEDRISVVKTRLNQSFFRETILATYENRCCITKLSVPKLLVASHIVPWAVDTANRLNPQNGLCLNSLHDRAFDQGLITLDEEYRIVLSGQLERMRSDDAIEKYFVPYSGMQIELPKRFVPNQSLLEYHRKNIFLR